MMENEDVYCKNGDFSCGAGLWTCDKCKAEEAQRVDSGLTQKQLEYDYNARHHLLGHEEDEGRGGED